MKVGDTLKQVLSNTWAIPTCGACHETAKRMNNLGVDGCRENVDELAEQLHQNATEQKWTSLTGAAVRFIDTASTAVVGNALYRKMILDICNYVERQCQPCVHRGKRCGNAPWNRNLERYRCDCESVEFRYCIASPLHAADQARGTKDDIAVCSLCAFNERQETIK